MARVLDKNYYPMPFPGGSSMVASVASGDNTLETHEFYDAAGKVLFYWKLKKNADGNLIDFRLKIPFKAASPANAYVGYDSLT
jgi:hypothetical protein